MSLKTNSANLGLEVRVPGSVANLGGGFDTLGVAVQLYLRARIVDVREDGGSRLIVAGSTPAVHGANALERGFDAIVRATKLRTPTVSVEVTSDVPMAAGLGSSAAATVAGLRVFECVAGSRSDGELLAAATAVEGHGDNAAPALFGGLTSVVDIEGREPLALRWGWPQDLRLVVATPAAGLATAKARAALAQSVPRRDAIYNLQRVLSLVHALEHGDYTRLQEAVKDRWHQPARAALVPLLREVLEIDDADVYGSFLSGAGPSVALFARDGRTARVEGLLRALYEHAGVAATIRTLRVHEGPSGAAQPAAAEPAGAAARRYDHPADAMASARGRTS